MRGGIDSRILGFGLKAHFIGELALSVRLPVCSTTRRDLRGAQQSRRIYWATYTNQTRAFSSVHVDAYADTYRALLFTDGPSALK